MTSRFFKNAALLALVELAMRIRWILLAPILTKHFGPRAYGAWSQMGVLLATTLPILFLGTDSAALRLIPGKSKNEQIRIFIAWGSLITLTSFSFATFIYLFQSQISSFFLGSNSEFHNLIPLTSLNLIVMGMNLYLKSIFRVRNEARLLARLNSGQALLGIIAALFALQMKLGIEGLVLIMTVADASVLAVLMLSFLSSGAKLECPDFSSLKPMIRFGLPLFPGAYAMWSLNWIDRVILVRYCSLADIGIYSLAYSMGYFATQIVITPIWMMYPSSAAELHNEGNQAGLQKLFEKSAGAILLFMIPLLAGMVILGRSLLKIISESQFTSGAPVLALVGSGYLFHILASQFEIYLGLIGRQGLSTVSLTLACVANFSLCLILIPHFGINGAAAATLFGFLSQFAFSWIAAHLLGHWRIRISFPLRVIFASMLMSAILLPFKFMFDTLNLLLLVCATLVGISFYFLFLKMLKISVWSELFSAIRN